MVCSEGWTAWLGAEACQVLLDVEVLCGPPVDLLGGVSALPLLVYC